MDIIELNDRNISTILELLDKKVNDEGYIVEKQNNKLVICPYSKEPILADNFSIMPGSFVFINNYPFCFTEHVAKYNLG